MGYNGGYYSLIQYCPDASRLEAANVGVLLFCEAPHYLKAKTLRSSDRIRRMFGPDYQIDLRHIDVCRVGIEHAIGIEGHHIRTLADLEAYINGLANEIRVTPPRPMRVSSPDAELDKLIRELVLGDQHQHTTVRQGRSAHRALRDAFGRPELAPHVRQDLTFHVPVFRSDWTVPYAYQNGRLNLVRAVDFGKTRPLEKACENAIAGESLWANPDPHDGERRLVVVASFVDEAQELEGVICELLRGHRVTPYNASDLRPLEEDVLASASHLAIE